MKCRRTCRSGLGFAVLAGRHDRADTHVRAESEEREQQAALKDVAVDAFVRGDGGEFVGEGGEEVGVLQHVQEVEDAPASYDFLLERLEAGGLIERLQLRHGDPRLTLAVGDLDPARAAGGERG
ncbi:hypothetical protein OG230_30225 [Streptomyces sp. NBC_00234]|uniref:hypothetical protein n=1 Tax=Streptomyces sp. NBC_00234 TaxID=2903638 RepID=UPI002E2E497F|nr:hypothetical protein [Streptomyces sp. NBC_00234]